MEIQMVALPLMIALTQDNLPVAQIKGASKNSKS